MKEGVDVNSMVGVEAGVNVEAGVVVAACVEGTGAVLVAATGGSVAHAATIRINTISAKPDP